MIKKGFGYVCTVKDFYEDLQMKFRSNKELEKHKEIV